MTVDDDNTLTSRKPGHRIKKLFGGGGASSPKKEIKKEFKPAETDKEAAPPKEEEVKKEVKEEEPVVAEDVVRAEPEINEKAPVEYLDDNDGKRDNTCAACEGCTIL